MSLSRNKVRSGDDVVTNPILDAKEDSEETAFRADRRKTRLRVVAVIVGSLVLVMGYVGWKIGRHLIAATWLEANNYRVFWGTDPTNKKLGGGTTVKKVFRWSISDSSLGNVDLVYLTYLHRLEDLDLSTSVGLTDADLVILDHLTDLRVLNLDRSRSLAYLNMDHGRLTDKTLARMKRLKNLKDLNLGGQPITDKGLANMAGLTTLESVELRMTGITDAGLEHLKALPRLKSVDLTGTLVTDRGITKFELDRPDVKIVFDSDLPVSSSKPALKP